MHTIDAPPALISVVDSDDDVSVMGVVTRVRQLKTFAFLHLLTEAGRLQAVWPGVLRSEVRVHAAVRAKGRFAPATLRDTTLTHRDVELKLTQLETLSTPSETAPVDLGKPSLDVGAEVLFDLRAVTLRHPRVAAIFTVQAALARGFRDYLHQQRFTEIFSPKIGAVGAEGGANVFELNYFGRVATLAQSPQFYKEFCTAALLRVYEVGPVFRAEKHATRRHLNQYTSMDVEFGPIASFADVMSVQVGVLRHMFATVARDCAPELDLLEVEVPEISVIPAIAFAEAKERIDGTSDPDLSPEEERRIGASLQSEHGDFVFVTHYPTAKRPFYAMDDPEDPAVTVSFDVLFRGVEITTGGQRIHDVHALEAKMRQRGLDPEAFRFFSDAHRCGLPPHGGFGMGLERLTQQLLGLSSIKEASLFPRDRNRLVP